MQPNRERLLALLADGEFHSGEGLGEALGISRAAVWKHVAAISELGLEVERLPGQGYRLHRPLELLSETSISGLLADATRARLGELRVIDSVDSTNALLMREYDASDDRVVACLAEQQTAGRGRRGRPWYSPFGANLYFSISWPFASLPPDFSALSLAMGVAARRALVSLGVDVQLKWPNDLYARGRKLGGILLEMRGEPPGPCRVVAGIGINVSMPEQAAEAVDQPWIDATTLLGEAPSRNALAAALLDCWVEGLATFECSGFSGFHREWRLADLLAGQEVVVVDAAQRWQGRARGVAGDGALEVETGGGVKRFVAGDASLREAR